VELNALFTRFIIVLSVSTFFFVQVLLAAEPSQQVDDFKALSATRQQQLQWLFPKSRDTASAAQLADATVLSELAINKRAADLNITATDAEVETFLIPRMRSQEALMV
jgi:hypothetical protein